MRNTILSLLVMAAALAIAFPTAFPAALQAAEKRALTIEDLYKIKSVSDPQYSPDGRYDESFLTNYANMRIKDELARIDGVGEVTLFSAEYGMRIWLDPDKMRARDLTTNDVLAAMERFKEWDA